MKRGLMLTAAAVALAAGSASASAATIAVLSGERTITLVDSESWAVTGSWDVSGIEGRLLGIDVRPADNKLYGVVAGGSVVTIDTATGAATEAAALEMTLADSAIATVDFNPVADAIRIMGSDGTNLRAKIDPAGVTVDGNHAFASGDAQDGKTPNVVAGSYINSHKGTESTGLYVIDGTTDTLLKQDPPNDGTLAAVGELGVEVGDTPAFDIASDGAGTNAAWLLSGGTMHSVDLESGAATAVGPIEGLPEDVRDMAVLPAT